MPAPWPPNGFGTAVESSLACFIAANVSCGNRDCESTSAACLDATSAAIVAVRVTSSLFLIACRVTRRRYSISARFFESVHRRDDGIRTRRDLPGERTEVRTFLERPEQ